VSKILLKCVISIENCYVLEHSEKDLNEIDDFLKELVSVLEDLGSI